MGKYKNYILFGGLIVAAFFTYWYFSRSSAPPAGTAPAIPDQTAALSNQVVFLLSKLQTAANKLNGSLASDPVFQSLRDGTVSIPPGVPGRANPFAPLAGASGGK